MSGPKKQEGMPDWIQREFESFMKQSEELIDYTGLSIVGLFEVSANAKNIKERVTDPRTTEVLEHILSRADTLRLDQGLPTLSEHAIKSLWEMTETFLRTFLAKWLASQPEDLKIKEIRKIRIRLADYERMSPEERYEYLVDELDRSLGAPLKSGSKRFEALLDVVGLSGAIDDLIAKDLFELSQVRNVIVHRQGVVDTRFAQACPWLKLKPGDKLLVNYDFFRRYVSAVMKYMELLFDRIWQRFAIAAE